MTHEGRVWHIEGQMNEHIRASALYYHDSQDITESYLIYGNNAALTTPETSATIKTITTGFEIFGYKNQGPAVQNTGSYHRRPSARLSQHSTSPCQSLRALRPEARRRKILER